MSTITRVKRIDPIQLGKMFAVIYGLLSLIFVPFFLLFAAASLLAGNAQGDAFPAMFGIGFSLIMIIIMPVFYAVSGFIFGVIGAFVYNLVAKWLGGIEVELE